jgi:hypothetical protein
LTTDAEWDHMFMDYDCNRDGIVSDEEWNLAGMCFEKIHNATMEFHPDLEHFEEMGERISSRLN